MSAGYHGSSFHSQHHLSSQLHNSDTPSKQKHYLPETEEASETVRYNESIVSNRDLTPGDTIEDSESKKHVVDKNESCGFGSRNQFDRASQLRRSRKKRRKSDAANTSEVLSPAGNKDVSKLNKDDASSPNKENMMVLNGSNLSKSASDIVKEEQFKVLSETLDNSTLSRLSQRLHERTFTSRAEYSSNYGNLI